MNTTQAPRTRRHSFRHTENSGTAIRTHFTLVCLLEKFERSLLRNMQRRMPLSNIELSFDNEMIQFQYALTSVEDKWKTLLDELTAHIARSFSWVVLGRQITDSNPGATLVFVLVSELIEILAKASQKLGLGWELDEMLKDAILPQCTCICPRGQPDDQCSRQHCFS